MFNNFKQIVSNYTQGKPLTNGLAVQKQFDNNDIDAAAETLEGAEQVKAQSENSIANSAAEMGKSVLTATQVIQQSKASSDQFIYNQGIKTAHETNKEILRQAALARTPDELNTIYSTYNAQNQGLLESMKDKMPDGYYQSFHNVVNGQQKTLFAYVQGKKQQIVSDQQFVNYQSSFLPIYKNYLAARESGDPKKISAAAVPLQGWADGSARWSDTATNQTQIAKMFELQQKALATGAIAKHIDHENNNYNVNSAQLTNYNTSLYDSATDNKELLHNVMLRKATPSQAIINSQGGIKNADQMAQQAHESWAVSTHLLQGKNIIGNAYQIATDPNTPPMAKKTAQYAIDEIKNGRGMELLSDWDNDIKATRQQYMNNPTPENFQSMAKRVQARAQSLNIPVESIDIMPQQYIDKMNSAYQEGYVRDDKGKITDINLETWNAEGFKGVPYKESGGQSLGPNNTLLEGFQKYYKSTNGVVFGNDYAQKFYNILPQKDGYAVDKQYAVMAAYGFRPKAVNWAKDQSQLFKDSSGKSISSNFGNAQQLNSYIREHKSDFSIDQLSALQGIPENKLIDNMQFQATYLMKDKTNPTRDDWNNAIKYVQSHASAIVQNQTAFVGKAINGPSYAISPSILQNYTNGAHLSQREVQSISKGIVSHIIDIEKQSYRQKEIVSGSSNKNLTDSEKETMINQHVMTPDDYTVITRNGLIFAHRVDGKEWGIDHTFVSGVMSDLDKYDDYSQPEVDWNIAQSAINKTYGLGK